MNGVSPQDQFLIYGAVVTALLIGGIFVVGVLWFNRRLESEQRDVEQIEEQGGFEVPDDK